MQGRSAPRIWSNNCPSCLVFPANRLKVSRKSVNAALPGSIILASVTPDLKLVYHDCTAEDVPDTWDNVPRASGSFNRGKCADVVGCAAFYNFPNKTGRWSHDPGTRCQLQYAQSKIGNVFAREGDTP